MPIAVHFAEGYPTHKKNIKDGDSSYGDNASSVSLLEQQPKRQYLSCGSTQMSFCGYLRLM